MINNKYLRIEYNNNDVLTTAIGDCFKSHLTPRWPTLDYYIKCISLIKEDNSTKNIYIATDNKSHKIYSQFFTWCCDNKLDVLEYEKDHVDTLLFGSTCKNVVLSAEVTDLY